VNAQCDDCGAIWDEGELDEAKDLWERVDEGNDPDEVLGECPDCGALCYEVEEAK
jgi:hypothetical protein